VRSIAPSFSSSGNKDCFQWPRPEPFSFYFSPPHLPVRLTFSLLFLFRIQIITPFRMIDDIRPPAGLRFPPAQTYRSLSRMAKPGLIVGEKRSFPTPLVTFFSYQVMNVPFSFLRIDECDSLLKETALLFFFSMALGLLERFFAFFLCKKGPQSKRRFPPYILANPPPPPKHKTTPKKVIPRVSPLHQLLLLPS